MRNRFVMIALMFAIAVGLFWLMDWAKDQERVNHSMIHVHGHVSQRLPPYRMLDWSVPHPNLTVSSGSVVRFDGASIKVTCDDENSLITCREVP